MIGKTVSHYKIISKLGEGGMGVVYKAEDTRLDRRVAIKFLPASLGTQDAAKKRFIQEAKAASSLEHPNICAVYDIGENDDGQMFIVMPHYDGETLQERIARGRLEIAEVIDIVTQLASGLAKAHEQGIVHRDIKPGNIFITKDGHVKILDFGLAKLANETRLTKSGMTLGTIAYMSPEQASGGDIDARSDIFSLGVVFYELLTGVLPFRGDHEAAIIYGILHNDPEPLSSERPDLPASFQSIVNRTLSKDRNDRYESVSLLHEDLRNLLPEQSGSPHARRRRRGLQRAAILFAAAVVVSVGAYGVYERIKSTQGVEEAATAENAFVIGVAPFWGQNAEAIEEGRVMQALVERRLVDELGEDENVTVLGKKDIVEAPQSHGDAIALGQELGATVVLWGEVIVLRDEVEVQPFVTRVKWFRHAQDWTVGGMEADLRGEAQLNLRKAKAEDVSQVALEVAGAYYRKKDPQRALALLRKIDPPTSESLVGQGLILLDGPSRNESESLFQAAIDLDSTNARAYWGVAGVRSGRRDWDGAIEWYKKAINVDPEFRPPYSGVLLCLANSGRYDEATRWFEETITRFPNFFWAYLNMGTVCFRQERYEEATTWVEKALATADNPSELASGYTFMGAIQRMLGNNDKGQYWYEKAIDSDRELEGPYTNIGNINYEAGRYDEAIRWYERGEQLVSGSAPFQFAVSCMMLEQYSKAVEILRLQTEVRPKDSYIALLYAICLHYTSAEREAEIYLREKVEELDNDDWIAPVLKYYSGALSEDQVLAQAASPDPKVDRERTCEVYYYLGVSHLLGIFPDASPDSVKAQQYFERCVAAAVPGFMEPKLAARALQSLSGRVK